MALINENDDGNNNEDLQFLDVYNILENKDNNKDKRIIDIFIIFYI